MVEEWDGIGGTGEFVRLSGVRERKEGTLVGV